MIKDFKHKVDISTPKRKYQSDLCGLSSCPECGGKLIEDSCTVLLAAKSTTDDGEFLSNLSGSHFCATCPVVVFDSEKIEQAARLGIRGDKNLHYLIAGIVDFNAIPPKKRRLEIGTDENPLPLVEFLPELKKTAKAAEKKVGRNEPCPCGSGKKFKKCCGAS